MSGDTRMVMIYSTFPDTSTATQAGERLVTQELAACVNILPQMTSIYQWEGKLMRDEEAVMLIKTRSSLASRVVAEIEAHHPYETPAVVVLEIAEGAQGYLAWLISQTQSG